MKIAVIGSGISGLGAASILSEKHDVTLFEKEDRVGGHARTINVEISGKTHSVDTGFIVFNYVNYPNLNAFFELLNVPVKESDMSFSASINNAKFEYGTVDLNAIFAQRLNILKPNFWKLFYDVNKFNKSAKKFLKENDPSSKITLGEFLNNAKIGKWCRDYYVYALGGSIWSAPIKEVSKFPAYTFLKFFDNHCLLSFTNQPRWHTVDGGSVEYLKRVLNHFSFDIKYNSQIESVTRCNQGVTVATEDKEELFDQAILACHADTAKRIIKDPSKEEEEILGLFKYKDNHIIVHSDESFMPKRQAAWASWNYLLEGEEDKKNSISLTYWMNRLQSIKSEKPILVTLNTSRRPKEHLIYDENTFSHPQYELSTIHGQKQIKSIQGKNKLWFCGAYLGYGFHEDGLKSSVDICKKIGVDWKPKELSMSKTDK